MSANERIYIEGDEAEHLYLVAMGKVKLVRNPVSGREVLLDILRGGEYFGSLTISAGAPTQKLLLLRPMAAS